MRIGNWIRNKIFWGLDFIQGNKIRHHLRDIEFILRDLDAKESINRRDQLLKELLNHAVNTTPYYSKYDTYSSLEDFPVIKKNIVIENFEKFRSIKYLNSKIHKVTTSGSTGMPFTIFHDSEKRVRNTADTIYFLQKNGYKVGEPLYYFRLWKGETKSRMKSFLQNVTKVDISKLSEEDIFQIVERLKKDTSLKSFIGIASSLETICHYLEDNNYEPINTNAHFFIANSDSLSPFTKTAVKKYFDAPIVSRYSNEELGIIAQQENNGSDVFRINWGTYFVEILDLESDVPAKPGVVGRIVVTDLYNYAMPLIRYDTGDLASYGFVNDEKVLTKVEGRKMDAVYTTSGELLSPYAIYPKMQDYYEYFNQYQFIQLGASEYLIKLNYKKDFIKEEEFRQNFKSLLGEDAQIIIEYVNEIPVLSSGKRKRVINLYNP
ncbi:CoF synthetase [Zhouia amylolytica]|uniref:CoF synthetase n=1 Tax=Zhouia amylolytica TaxID=376730 RepID=UPI0020CF8E32|nr:CoF synthetase [Zhouia amylolytica]MCQ0111868.1 CoF synthetase [Zhouia amylolytica]